MDNIQILAILSIFAFILGSMVGSFLNVCVYRIPQGQSIVRPRSKCPKCENAIAWYDNIPLVSWLTLGAKCRHCGQPISWQYPLGEALTGTLFFLVFWRFGLAAATPVYMLLSAALVLVTFVDLTDWTIPDEVTLPGIPVGIAISAIGMFLGAGSGLQVTNVFESLLGALLGAGILYGMDKLSLLLLKKRGMGLGDVKLMAMLGAFFGWWGVLLIIMIAAVLGSVVGLSMVYMQKRRGDEEGSHYLPFGPYLSVAGLIVMFYGSTIWNAYFGTLSTVGPKAF